MDDKGWMQAWMVGRQGMDASVEGCFHPWEWWWMGRAFGPKSNIKRKREPVCKRSKGGAPASGPPPGEGAKA